MCRFALRAACACALAVFCVMNAQAQLVFGTTTPTGTNGGAFYLNVTTHEVTTMWNSTANKKVNGFQRTP